MPHAFLVNGSLKYMVEITKAEKKAAKIIRNIERLAGEMKYSRDFQLGKEQQKVGGTDLY